jgi:lipopolysaccharide/colanic/teichoic acid biosynthesis glycosyltransferase
VLKNLQLQREPLPVKISSSVEHFSQEFFHKLLALEKKRTERSNRSFLLALVDCGNLTAAGNDGSAVAAILDSMSQSARETDIRGWYEQGAIAGLIFTEIDRVQAGSIAQSIHLRLTRALARALRPAQYDQLAVSIEVYPEEWDENGPDKLTKPPADRVSQAEAGKIESVPVKRFMDIAGSLVALILSAPLFLLIAIAIKLTSKGPVLFKQVRVGQHGKRFTFLKFRSMYYGNDHKIHEEFTKRLIAGKEEQNGGGSVTYKITADPRVTPVGKLLRKSSLDELPQFLNILRGEMSLVGPRPPVTYEYERYELWHRQRLESVKPGLTGLWQVEGRSRVKFDDMVRLDIRYARTWSLWLDIKIIVRTPMAVLMGNGAY